MTTTTDDYLLGRTAAEYERLVGQARWWEPETARVLDAVSVPPGGHCLDAGCGPGEVMRLMAERVGPDGRVLGIDVDEVLGARGLERLHAAGYGQCAFAAVDLTCDVRVPGTPFDIVYARLLLLHMGDKVATVRRLWDCVAPGGHLVVHDHDLLTAEVVPPLPSVDEFLRVVRGTFDRLGLDLRLGLGLPALFAAAGIGAPDGMDAAARVEVMPTLAPMYVDVFRSVLPAAVAHGLTTAERGEAWFDDFAREATAAHEHAALWPLLIAAHKRKDDDR
jgi:SAM-dependent methyltransferase